MTSLTSHEILPLYHPPPSSTPTPQHRHLTHALTRPITTPLLFLLHLRTSKPLATLSLIYALSISGPSAPQFDILTLYETSRGCFILTVLFLWTLFFFQYLQVRHWVSLDAESSLRYRELRDVQFLICILLTTILAFPLLRLSTSLSKTEVAEVIPKALSMIPVALTFLIVISEKIMVCIVNGVVYGVPVLRHGMQGVRGGCWGRGRRSRDAWGMYREEGGRGARDWKVWEFVWVKRGSGGGRKEHRKIDFSNPVRNGELGVG
ncbi:uncharacterized protein Bfra_011722 [Botrytis fragariae]|uniref:Uncharacterized protein n=1 Tax=Botrytis fragariae TaxID=1964551 RepID=A0A8H6AKR4_9HELO|nr:uncharacterized protein Bfra_011722 [Botrytis fragariae]KAF5869179.1 hypothetical protein Bfra_011722 [Botrytis fragariae]